LSPASLAFKACLRLAGNLRSCERGCAIATSRTRRVQCDPCCASLGVSELGYDV
jgi:hypothetical protein